MTKKQFIILSAILIVTNIFAFNQGIKVNSGWVTEVRDDHSIHIMEAKFIDSSQACMSTVSTEGKILIYCQDVYK